MGHPASTSASASASAAAASGDQTGGAVVTWIIVAVWG